MPQIFEVNSLPLREVIEGLAESMQVDYHEKCSEYFLSIPEQYGSGEIRGINFDNGLGILTYNCNFKEDVRIEFTVDSVHPVKYLFAVNGPIRHSFANEDNDHFIEQFKCAIVASEQRSGHVLNFEKGKQIHLISLEIDRDVFVKNLTCEVEKSSPALRALFLDSGAEKGFYHDGYYGIDFKRILESLSKFEDRSLVRKLHLESVALDIFVKQMILFEDDGKIDKDRKILRTNELERIEGVANFIRDNLNQRHTLDSLSLHSGFNQNKLQAGFRYLFHQTVNDFISTARLTKASLLIISTELSIKEIANKVGIDNQSYFSKTFKLLFGVTPMEFRNLNRLP
jgi:AraC-like DNA-binding protein